MTALIVVQQGGIVVGVAQTLAAGLPLTTAGRQWDAIHDEAAALLVAEASARRGGDVTKADDLAVKLAAARTAAAALPAPPDETAWCLIIGAVTAVLLAIGRYRLIELVSLALVGTFTLVTLLALVMLQLDPTWAIAGSELVSGLVPALPPAINGSSPLVTALATFGIIGVGASELMIYPYWCLEKGYGAAVGPRDDTPAWARRARGWLRVMQLDAWASMVVYTLVTICFYLLGAATLGRLGLVPAGSEMVRTLGAMYAPVFGTWASGAFLIGAFAVLYSTLFVAAAGNARMVADGLILAGWLPADERSRAGWARWISVAWVLAATLLALLIRQPVAMVLASGIAQSVMLAAIGAAVVYFRWRETDPRLAPSRAWDALLAVSVAGLVTVGLWTLWEKLAQMW